MKLIETSGSEPLLNEIISSTLLFLLMVAVIAIVVIAAVWIFKKLASGRSKGAGRAERDNNISAE